MRMLLRLLVGALGGLSATGPMTIVMILLHRILPFKERYSLPPREITVHLAQKADLHKKLNSEARAALTLINHFGYGALAATAYALVESRFGANSIAEGSRFRSRSMGGELFRPSSRRGHPRTCHETSAFKKSAHDGRPPHMGSLCRNIRRHSPWRRKEPLGRPPDSFAAAATRSKVIVASFRRGTQN